MTPPVVTGVSVAVLLAGLVLFGWAWKGTPADRSRFRTRLTRVRDAGQQAAVRRRAVHATAAVVCGGLVWVVSGWPVAGIVVAVGVWWVPFFFGAAREANRRIERLEAVEEWVRRLADSMAAGTAPVQALVASAARAPGPIRPEVDALAAGLSSPRADRGVVLRRFATEMDDPLGDMVVLALGIAVSGKASHRVPDVLRTLAAEVADDVRARRKTETDRAEPRNEARTIIVVQVLFVAGVTVFTDYVQVYGTAAGQLVLAAFGTVVLSALWLLRRFSQSRPAPRILTDHPTTTAATTNTATTAGWVG